MEQLALSCDSALHLLLNTTFILLMLCNSICDNCWMVWSKMQSMLFVIPKVAVIHIYLSPKLLETVSKSWCECFVSSYMLY